MKVIRRSPVVLACGYLLIRVMSFHHVCGGSVDMCLTVVTATALTRAVPAVRAVPMGVDACTVHCCTTPVHRAWNEPVAIVDPWVTTMSIGSCQVTLRVTGRALLLI